MRVNKYKVHNSTRVTSSQKDAPLWQRQTDRQTETLHFRVYSARALWVPFCWLLLLRSVIACTRRAFQQSERPVTTRLHARAARSTWAGLHPLLTAHHSYCPHHVEKGLLLLVSAPTLHPPPSPLAHISLQFIQLYFCQILLHDKVVKNEK